MYHPRYNAGLDGHKYGPDGERLCEDRYGKVYECAITDISAGVIAGIVIGVLMAAACCAAFYYFQKTYSNGGGEW